MPHALTSLTPNLIVSNVEQSLWVRAAPRTRSDLSSYRTHRT